MDRNKKQNNVRYKCQVRDINKKACLTRASGIVNSSAVPKYPKCI